MSQTEADIIYGRVVFHDDNFVIRVLVKDKQLRVITHPVVNGEEMTPQSYVLGENALVMKGK